MKTELEGFLETFTHDPSFLARYPYYAAVLARMIPVADPSVARMAVSIVGARFYLHVNVDAFLEEPQYLRGVLLHEVHHLVLGHLAHPKFADPAAPELMDLALEMSANEHIEEPLPNPIVWQAYAQIGIRAGQSSIERYEKLREAMRTGAWKGRPVPGIGEPRVDDHRFLRGPARDPGAVEQTRQLLEKARDEAEERLLGGEDRPRMLVAGKEPGRLIEELTGVRGPAESALDWKVALRMFVARARAPVHTYARPSRRFPARVGEVPGRAWSPRVIDRPRLLVAIDTSSSMSSAELAEVARQLARMAEHAIIVIAECDTEIARVYPFTGTIDEVAGRGGTDLRPVFARAFLGAQKADGVVYFTDGEGPYPGEPPGVPVLWVLTKAGEFGCPWGTKARLTRARGW